MYPWLTSYEAHGDRRGAVKIGNLIAANDGDICLAAITQELLQSYEAPFCLDIGFAAGWWSCFVASYFSKSKCIGFEPNPTTYKQALENIRGYPSIELHNLAISDQFGILPFEINGEESNSRCKDSEIYVACDIVDKYLPKDQPVSFVKIDTEGHDLIILGTLLPYLDRIDTIVFECSVYWYADSKEYGIRKTVELISKLQQSGKSIYGMSRRGEPRLYNFKNPMDLLHFLDISWNHKYQIDILATNQSISKVPIQNYLAMFQPKKFCRE